MKMTLEQKIGQMLLLGFEGDTPNSSDFQDLCLSIKEGLCSGLIAFKKNLKNSSSWLKMREHLTNCKIPPFIALDQEGGKVVRFPIESEFIKQHDLDANFLSPFEIAHAYSPKDSERYYKIFAEWLHLNGFNLNFAPCVDLHSKDPRSIIGASGRSYGTEPELVSNYARSFISAHDSCSVLTCLKHFPGHGLALGDSHAGLIDITHTWEKRELEPFYSLIKENYARMIMVAHLYHQSLDNIESLSLSPTFVTQYLRKNGNYSGVIVSDDLHMGSIVSKYELADVIKLGVQAGLDLFVFSNYSKANLSNKKIEPMTPSLFINTVLSLLDSNTIKEEQISESCTRIIKLKNFYRNKLQQKAYTDSTDSALDCI